MKTVIQDLYLDGLSPQKVIKVMNGIIGKTKLEDRRYLRIEEYDENFGNPFAEPTRCLRVVLEKNDV